MSMSLWKRKRKKEKKKHVNIPHSRIEQYKDDEINGNLEDTIAFVQSLLGDNDDLIIRRFSIYGTHSAALFYISNLVEQQTINHELLKPLMELPDQIELKELEPTVLLSTLSEQIIYHGQIGKESHLVKLVDVILAGETVLAMDSVQEALHIDTRYIEKRAVSQPETEQVIIGPREGFIERLGTNIGLLRYRLPTADLCIKSLKVGRLTKSKVAICYLKGISDQALVNEVEKRLKKIDIDAVLDVGYIEQYIEDNHYTPFTQTLLTERPDSAVGNLIEGRVAILVDGSPFAMLVPAVFNQFYQATEDYSTRFAMGSFQRFIRMFALVFSLIVPGLYVSFISFNPELLPTDFAVAVAGGRSGVPYPAVIEVLILEVAMEILREATVRLPKQIGNALSIVGVLIVGDAAVQAGLSSPITVVVIAITTIASFATPVYSAAFALRLLRFPLAILAGLFGLYGLMVGLIMVLNHMLSLKSFGVPYLSPTSPWNTQGMKDSVIRFPFWWMPKRPKMFQPKNKTRVKVSEEEIKSKPSQPLNPLNKRNK